MREREPDFSTTHPDVAGCDTPSCPLALLSIDNISISFRTPHGPRPTVRQMSLELRRGEITGLVGESGSGKTLVSLSVLGLLPTGAEITGGRIVFDGKDLLKMSREDLRRLRGNRISMIFQDPHASLDPVVSCGEQIADALRIHQPVSRREARARARDLLVRLRLPDPDRAMTAYPHELSGGQCQRVMIAMAVACKPDVIIADEPTTALDVTVQKEVLDLLRELNDEIGAAVLLITHDLGVVAQVADRVVVMCRGDLVETATTRDIFTRPQAGYTRDLIAAMPRIGGNRFGPAPVVPPADPSATPLLELQNISKHYLLGQGFWGAKRVFRAVDNVSLRLAARSTLGLVGESGCGKSTLSRLILQMQEPTSGRILFEGRDITGLKGADLRAARAGMAMVFQNPYGSLNPRQTVQDLIAAPLQINGRGAEGPAKAARLIDAVGLPRAALHKFPHEFSGGQRQRIAIARALALAPRLLICDEAVSALDVSVQAQVLELLKDLQQEFSLTCLFISHDLAVVESFCDEIVVMRSGHIVEQGPAAQLFSASAEDYTRQLLAASPRINFEMETSQ